MGDSEYLLETAKGYQNLYFDYWETYFSAVSQVESYEAVAM